VKKEEWITAAEALRLLKPVLGGEYAAKITICKRAHAGLIRARAERFMIDDRSAGAQKVPEGFWWAEGHSALEQNWTSGDFATWVGRDFDKKRHRAFGVSFSRADIEKLIPTEPEASPAPKPDGETGRNRAMEWDVFISHASEDKEDFVRPLADSLRRAGLSVWYDEFTLKVGDSLRRSIDHGLAKSRYGIAVISPNFLKKDWPQKELDGLFAREVEGPKVILPVWHNIRADEIRGYSPTLADRVAVSSSKGIDDVTKQLMKAIGKGDTLERKEIIGGYPSPGSDQINSFVSEIGDFSGTKFDVAGSGKSDRALEYFLNVIGPALSKAGWVHIDWIWDTDGDTFQMLSPSTTTKRHYGVVTGVPNVAVEAAIYGDKNEAADVLVNALNKIGISATKEYANSTNHNRDAVHILVGQMR
jgi:hypothetical protein